MKRLSILILLSGCQWIASHPKEDVEAIEGSIKVIEQIIEELNGN